MAVGRVEVDAAPDPAYPPIRVNVNVPMGASENGAIPRMQRMGCSGEESAMAEV